MGNLTDETTEKPLKSLLQKYQEALEEKVRGSEFYFDVILIYCIMIFIK